MGTTTLPWRPSRRFIPTIHDAVDLREIQSKNPEWGSVDDVEWNIAAGIFYDRQLWRLWRDGVDDADHHRFMFGSYHAGRVPILTAQRLTRERQLDPRGWGAIERVAPEVPRWRHRETVDYVGRIGENLERLDGKGRVIRTRPSARSATGFTIYTKVARKRAAVHR